MSGKGWHVLPETTVAGGNFSAGISTQGNTAGTTGVASNQVIFVGGNNITLSQSTGTAGNTLSIIGAAGGAGDGYNIVRAGTTGTSGTTWSSSNATVQINGSQNITVSQNNSNNIVIVGPSLTPYLQTSQSSIFQHTSATSAITANAFPTANTTALAQSSASNVSAVYAGTNATGGTATLAGGVSFSNANGVSFYTSAGNAVVATVKTDYLTTAAQVSHSHGNPSLSLVNLTGATASASNGLTISLTGVAAQTSQTNNYYAAGNTIATNSTSITGSNLTFAGSGAVSLGVSNGSVVVSSPVYAVTNVTTNNMATAERNNYFYTSNNTFANSTHSHGNPSLSLVNLTGATASASNGLTISLTGVAAQTNQVNTYSAAGNTIATNSTSMGGYSNLVFAGSGIASVGVSNGSVVVSVPSGGGAGDGYNIISISGNTSGTLASQTTGTIVLAGGNNITLSQSGTRITISGPSGGGIGVSNVGKTYGSTGAVSDQVVFAGTGGVVLSQSTNAQSATVSIMPAPMSMFPTAPFPPSVSRSVISGTSGAGSTSAAFYVCPFVLPADLYAQEVEFFVSNGAFSAGTGSATIGYHLGFYTNNAGTLSQVSSFSAAARYSVNSATAVTAQYYWGANSTANSTQTSGNISAAWVTGVRDVKVYDASFTLPANTYYAVVCLTQRSSSVNVCASHMTLVEASYNRPVAYMLATTSGAPSPNRIMGSFTSQMTGAAGNTLSMSMPTAIQTTAITQTHSSGYASFIPYMYN